MMIEAKVLADALVDAGIAFKNVYGYSHTRIPMGADFVDAHDLLRDWRVAGKCLELMGDQVIYEESAQATDFGFLRHPREIIEAWYAAQ